MTSALVAVILFAIDSSVKIPSGPIGEIGLRVVLFGSVPFAYGYSIGSGATQDVGYLQQIACVLCVPLIVVTLPMMMSRGGDAGNGVAIITLMVLPGLLALIPGWLLGSLLNTKTLTQTAGGEKN